MPPGLGELAPDSPNAWIESDDDDGQDRMFFQGPDECPSLTHQGNVHCRPCSEQSWKRARVGSYHSEQRVREHTRGHFCRSDFHSDMPAEVKDVLMELMEVKIHTETLAERQEYRRQVRSHHARAHEHRENREHRDQEQQKGKGKGTNKGNKGKNLDKGNKGQGGGGANGGNAIGGGASGGSAIGGGASGGHAIGGGASGGDGGLASAVDSLTRAAAGLADIAAGIPALQMPSGSSGSIGAGIPAVHLHGVHGRQLQLMSPQNTGILSLNASASESSRVTVSVADLQLVRDQVCRTINSIGNVQRVCLDTAKQLMSDGKNLVELNRHLDEIIQSYQS